MSERVTRSKRALAECASDCSICLEPISKNDPFRLPCGHTFHAVCIMKNVVLGQSTCPLCRGKFGKQKKTEDAIEEEEEEGEEEEEASDDSDYDEELIQSVANRMEQKLRPADVEMFLQRFRILTDVAVMSRRDKIELLAEQLTHHSDDEDDI